MEQHPGSDRRAATAKRKRRAREETERERASAAHSPSKSEERTREPELVGREDLVHVICYFRGSNLIRVTKKKAIKGADGHTPLD